MTVVVKPLERTPGSLPQRVRDDAAFVMSGAQHVTIVAARLQPYAQELVASSVLVTELDKDNHFVSKAAPAQTAAYVLALDSINFGSGVFAAAQDAGINLEYAPVAQSLKSAFIKGICNNPEKWCTLTAGDCHRIFNIPEGQQATLDALMQDFTDHLRLTGAAVLRDFGSLDALLENYRGRGLALLDKCAAWPHFADFARYQGRDIAIYKRAQILLADLELALGSPQKPYFGSLEQLTCFADNMVPHVLRSDGILTYSPDLAARVDAGDFIDAGSDMEIELRCAAIHTVELMRDILGGAYTSVNIDHMLWHRGYQPGFSTFKTHRTISTWY